jgi:hypothetical protein
MFATVTRTRGSRDEPLEVATFAGETMLPWLREIDGFEGIVMLSNEVTFADLGSWPPAGSN